MIFGVAYKRDINDVRESPAIDIIKLLINAGAKVDYHDEYVPELDYDDLSMQSTTDLNNIKLNSYDACVIITDHSNVDYEFIYNQSRLIIDTRNVYSDKDGSHIKRLGQG